MADELQHRLRVVDPSPVHADQDPQGERQQQRDGESCEDAVEAHRRVFEEDPADEELLTRRQDFRRRIIRRESFACTSDRLAARRLKAVEIAGRNQRMAPKALGRPVPCPFAGGGDKYGETTMNDNSGAGAGLLRPVRQAIAMRRQHTLLLFTSYKEITGRTLSE